MGWHLSPRYGLVIEVSGYYTLKGPDIKSFVIFLEFHFNSNKRITGANQNSRLGTYSNTNLILKTTERMIYKVPSLHYLHHFAPLAAVFLLGTSWITLKSLLFSLRLRVCVVVFIHEKENWQNLTVFFPLFVTPLSTMLWSRVAMYPERGTLLNVSRSVYIWF